MPPSKSTHDLPSNVPRSVLREESIESAFIKKLRGLKYIDRPDIHDRAALEQNFREKFEALNRVHLTDAEFSRLLDEIITPDVFAASKTLRAITSFAREDGTPLNYMMMRPYQVYAVKAIVETIRDNSGNGYIWHTTGSGKTLTSFKASKLRDTLLPKLPSGELGIN